MVSLNKVILAGNLVKDPELTMTPNGSSKAKFPIAVNRRWRDKSGEMKSEAGFFNVVVWSGTAENCAKYLTKGRPVLVEGRLSIRTFDDKSGARQYYTEIIGNTVSFLSSGNGKPSSDQFGAAASDEPEIIDSDCSDLPF